MSHTGGSLLWNLNLLYISTFLYFDFLFLHNNLNLYLFIIPSAVNIIFHYIRFSWQQNPCFRIIFPFKLDYTVRYPVPNKVVISSRESHLRLTSFFSPLFSPFPDFPPVSHRVFSGFHTEILCNAVSYKWSDYDNPEPRKGFSVWPSAEPRHGNNTTIRRYKSRKCKYQIPPYYERSQLPP